MHNPVIQNVLADLHAARKAESVRKSAIANIEQALTEAMRKLLPTNSVIDLEIVENTPSFLMSVVTLQGSDRGTKLFRIENVLRVDIDLLHPNLSRWHADAIPLSRKTGKDMSGRPGNKRSAARTTVRIAGYIDVLNKTGDRDKSIFNLLDICGNE